jgi:uncharacterized membrane protein YkoI
MRSSTKLILIVAVILGVAALSAGIAVAAGGTSGDQANPAVASEEPGDDENGAAEANDDTAEGADDSEGPGDDENGAGETSDDGAEGADESDGSLTGEAATKAADAALAATGGGTVLAAEPDDGNAGYEVEIRKADGSEAEVELDKNFKVVQRAEDD